MTVDTWVKIQIDITGLPPDLVRSFQDICAEICGGIEELESGIVGYLAVNPSGEKKLHRLKAELSALSGQHDIPGTEVNRRLTTSYIGNTDWATNWKQYYKPQRIGEHFWVFPSWEKPAKVQPQDKLILLDPGQAFGTGQHESTRLCIRLMEQMDLSGLHVADVGCGSGILSIAALLSGAESVFGCDIDGKVIEIASENARKNLVHSRSHFRRGSAGNLAPEAPFDIVFANILAEILLNIGGDLVNLTRSGGSIIWSGILGDQANQMEEYFRSLGVSVTAQLREGEWIGYLTTV